MIAAPVQCDVDGVPKGSHFARVPPHPTSGHKGTGSRLRGGPVATTGSPHALPIDQSSGRARKSRLAFLYHAMPEMGCLHLPFISFKALLCVSSPLETISFKCLSCALMTSSAVSPRRGRSHGPPNCLHVIVFIAVVSFRGSAMGPSSIGSSNASAWQRSRPYRARCRRRRDSPRSRSQDPPCPTYRRGRTGTTERSGN